jgi:hypothetical protein
MAGDDAVLGELFELELFGERIEKRYRKLRPDVEAMPWGTLDVRDQPAHVVVAARSAWTGAAFQEHRTGVACAVTLKALMEARAPLDLIAISCRFPLDEMVHVELCSRLAMELGGGSEVRFDPHNLVYEPSRALSPLRIATELVVHNFCVGEALSIPMLRGAAKAANQPLTRAVLSRIVRDEAMHGSFGWSYLEWAKDYLTPEDLRALSRLTARSIRGVVANWEYLRRDLLEGPTQRPKAHALGWMQTRDYLTLAAISIEKKVLIPLAKFGIDPKPYLHGELEDLVPPAGAMPNAEAAAE